MLPVEESQNAATSAARLQELAVSNPETWSSILQHPNVYPGLADWITQQQMRQEPVALAQPASVYSAPDAYAQTLSVPQRGPEPTPSYAHGEPQRAPSGGPTNTMAIIALVAAFVVSPVGLVLGYLARKQIDQSGEAGRGFATAAIVLGWIWVAAVVLWFVVAMATFSSFS